MLLLNKTSLLMPIFEISCQFWPMRKFYHHYNDVQPISLNNEGSFQNNFNGNGWPGRKLNYTFPLHLRLFEEPQPLFYESSTIGGPPALGPSINDVGNFSWFWHPLPHVSSFIVLSELSWVTNGWFGSVVYVHLFWFLPLSQRRQLRWFI